MLNFEKKKNFNLQNNKDFENSLLKKKYIYIKLKLIVNQ